MVGGLNRPRESRLRDADRNTVEGVKFVAMVSEPQSLTALVIGCGSIGTRHAENLACLGLDVSVYDIDPEQRRRLASSVDGQTFETLDTALETEPDIAVVATPSGNHVAPARKAARAGCDLFVEKPISSDEVGAADLVEVVETGGLISMIGCNLRFHPAIATLHELVDEDAIGSVIAARIEGGSYLPEWHPDEDHREMYSATEGIGGALLDYIHEINYARWIFGSAERVTAMLGYESSLEIETEDTAALIVKFGDNTLCEIHVDYVQRTYSRSYQVIGEEGTIRWQWDEPKVQRYDPDASCWLTEASWSSDWELNSMYVEEMKHFLECVRRQEETLCPVDEGYRDLQVALAAKESAETGRHIQL